MSSLATTGGPATLCGHVPFFGLTAKRVMTVEGDPVTGAARTGHPGGAPLHPVGDVGWAGGAEPGDRGAAAHEQTAASVSLRHVADIAAIDGQARRGPPS